MAGGRGALIVLEGMDRAGKSTQCQRLVQALRAAGHRADLLRFPERTTEIGRLIGAYLARERELEDHAVHLLFSANRWEHAKSMKEKLHQGITLVVDRYAFSGVAFTSAKEVVEEALNYTQYSSSRAGTGNQYTWYVEAHPDSSITVHHMDEQLSFLCLGQNFCLDWCKQPDIGLPKPDLILFLQLSPGEAAARGDFGSERYENSPFQEKVLQSFCHLMKDKTLNWKTMNASKSIEDLHKEIKSVAEETMQEVKNKPLGELWK